MLTIAVIMGVYNIANYDILSVSVYSILNQSYTNFEFIICDDGCTNETFQWLSKFVELDNRIVLIKNMELAYSLNKCTKKSVGKFIARQDADDISHPKRLEEEVHFLNHNPHVDFVGTNLKYFSNNYFGENISNYPNRNINSKTILYGGRTEYRKGIYRALKIFEELWEDDYYIKLRIFGADTLFHPKNIMLGN